MTFGFARRGFPRREVFSVLRLRNDKRDDFGSADFAGDNGCRPAYDAAL